MASTDLLNPRAQLIATLQMAYSGELAAGFAYRGHWHSVRDPEERRRIKQIEDEEWHHRKLVGEMLESPVPVRIKCGRCERPWWGECWDCCVTSAVGSRRCTERAGSRVAISSSMKRRRVMRSRAGEDLIDCLLTMAEVEWEHEKYFRSCAASSLGQESFDLARATTTKETIRASFQMEVSHR